MNTTASARFCRSRSPLRPEYDLYGTVTTTGGPAAASFVTILTVHDGEIVHWREYRDTLGMAASLGRLPALLASLGGS